jgi:hypothetical protein
MALGYTLEMPGEKIINTLSLAAFVNRQQRNAFFA